MSRFIRAFLLVIGIIAGITAANGQILYGANGAGGNPATVLGTINPATGAFTPIGAIGFAVTGLAVHPTTGVLYGTTGGNSPVSPNSLITINRTTGAGTLVGPHGFGPIADITFRASGVLFGWSEATDDLVTINLATGVATVVGLSGLGTSGSGIAFDNGGVLYYAGSGATGMLRTLNPATGAPTNVAVMTGAPIGGQVNAMAVNPVSNVLFAIDFTGGGAAGPANLITINKTTAVVTNIGVTGPGMDAIAFVPVLAGAAPPAQVPTLSEWTTILLALLIAAVAVVGWRRFAPPSR